MQTYARYRQLQSYTSVIAAIDKDFFAIHKETILALLR